MSTIFALSSGALPSAIAIFRLSGAVLLLSPLTLTGPRSAAVLTRLTARKVFKPRVIFHSRILGEDGRQLDSAMAVFLPGPSTFTGEDTAEIFVHGGKAIADALSSTLSRIPGLRHAHAGEFTKRALLNGKLSTTEVAALGALLQAATPRQLAQANRALQEGDWLAERIQGLRGRVALVADFGEDVHTDVEDVRREMASLVAELREKRRRGEAAARVRNGLRAVLVGRPNVGKSSIFNRLGTTRDTIEVTVNVEGVPLTLTDTAGLRDSDDPVEEEGIRRTRNKMEDADVVVGVVSGEKATEEEADIRALLPEGKELIVVRNKADLVPPEVRAENPGVWTTATEPEGVAALERELEATVAALCPPDSELSLSAGMPEVERLLDEALTHTDIGLTAELLQEAAEAWGRAHSNDHVLSIIMRDFCIGK